MRAILDGKTPDPPIADDRMCTVGQIYLKTLATLPEPERLRIYGLAVELMAPVTNAPYGSIRTIKLMDIGQASP